MLPWALLVGLCVRENLLGTSVLRVASGSAGEGRMWLNVRVRTDGVHAMRSRGSVWLLGSSSVGFYRARRGS